MSNKVHFRTLATYEETLNGTHEYSEIIKVPAYIARRAERLIGEPEAWILDADANTITFHYATGDEFSQDEFDRLVWAARNDMMPTSLEIKREIAWG